MKAQFTQDVALCAGDIADLFMGSFGSNGTETNIVAKIGRMPQDSDLLQSEGQILKDLKGKLPQNSFAFCIPKVFDSFPLVIKTRSAGISGVPTDRMVNILEAFPGFFDCEAIRQMHTGIDGRTLAWMWKRLVGLLTWVHHLGYVHGAILPPHVMYWPDGSKKDERTHSIRLVDWCYAVKKKTRLKAWIPDFKDFYPPEVIHKHLVGPFTDLYMGAKTMLYLCGGDVKTNRWPARIPGQMVVSLNKCLQKEILLRPEDAPVHFKEFTAIVNSVYGPRKFHEFTIPGV